MLILAINKMENIVSKYENTLILSALIIGGILMGAFCFLYPFSFPEAWMDFSGSFGEIHIGRVGATAIVLFLAYFLGLGFFIKITKKTIKIKIDETGLNSNSLMEKFWTLQIIYALIFIMIIWYLPEKPILESAISWALSSAFFGYILLPQSYSNKIYSVIIIVGTIISLLLPVVLILTNEYGQSFTNILHGSGATLSQWALSHLKK